MYNKLKESTHLYIMRRYRHKSHVSVSREERYIAFVNVPISFYLNE